MLFPDNNNKKKKCQERTTRRRRGRKKEGSAADGRFSCLGEYGEMIKETESRPQKEREIQSFLCFTLKCRQPSFTPLIHELWWEKSIGGKKNIMFQSTEFPLYALITQHLSVNVTHTGH